jgi:hypothetical protein
VGSAEIFDVCVVSTRGRKEPVVDDTYDLDLGRTGAQMMDSSGHSPRRSWIEYSEGEFLVSEFIWPGWPLSSFSDGPLG